MHLFYYPFYSIPFKLNSCVLTLYNIIFKVMLEAKAKVYSIQVSNISCINCASALTNILSSNLSDPQAKIKVNIMNETVLLTTQQDQIARQAIEILSSSKYKPLGQPLLISGNNENQRSISFFIQKNIEKSQINLALQSLHGIVQKKITDEGQTFKIDITYDSASVKGRDIANVLEQFDKEYTARNDRIQSLRVAKKISEQGLSIRTTIFLCLYFMVVNMILPVLPYFQTIYQECVTFPNNFGIYSLSVLFNIGLTLYVMNTYARKYIERAYQNYREFNATNMQTLVALGSLSAFSLFVFFFVRYTIEIHSNTMVHTHKAIMDINDSLTSASIIVLVVTIGKHLEKTVKMKIVKMSDQIFPQSVLFKNMKTTYVEIKNRKLIILQEKQYDVSLIEKNDIIRVQPGVLLLDVIVISGTAKVTQSARTGSDQVLQVGKGERIESGSVVHEVTGCLAIVEKVVEQSLLIDLVTHVKFSQNEQEGQASAIETLCRRIANYFVRGVIILSTLTMLTWAFILGFSLTEVPVCDVCWIIERGIGVLVASCPCALGLAIPSVIANVLNLAIKSGILIKKTHIFEKIKKTGIVAFDKTGTLFTKINHIEDRIFLNKTMNQEQVWQILAILQRDFRHPLAEIIYRQAFRNSKITGTNFSFITLQNQFLPSQGIKAKLLNKTLQKQMTILLGNRTLLRANGIDVQGLNMQKEAHTTIYLAIDEHVQMVLYINTHSNLRPETVQVIKKIQEQGFQVHIISGDSKESVEKLGKNINLPIENLHGEHTANDKLQWISRIQSAGNMVMMIGDGLNDIPCLQQAGIGISINAKSELNINAADVVVLSENLQKVLALIRFLKRGNLFIRINLLWAFAYNLFIMPITAGALYHFNIFVSPVWSSIAMSCSSLIVVGFSHLLTVFHYDDSMIEKEGLGKEGPTMVDLTVSGREVMTLNEEIS